MADGTNRATKHRERAAELRIKAQTMTIPENIKATLALADNYEQLAKDIEDVTLDGKA